MYEHVRYDLSLCRPAAPVARCMTGDGQESSSSCLEVCSASSEEVGEV